MKTRTLITGIAALFLATGTAQANELRDVWGPGALHPLLPPKEYDHPFAGEILVIDELEPQAMRDNCDSQWRDKELAGCAYHLREANTDRCIVMLTKKAEIEKSGIWTVDMVLRHEIGHCNGWPQTHEGARWGLSDQPDPWSKPAIRPNPGD